MINRTGLVLPCRKEECVYVYSQENILTHLCSTSFILLMLGFVSFEISNWTDFFFLFFTDLAVVGQQFGIRDCV